MMRPNCYIDFDGTIVSNKKRLFHFFQDYIPIEYKNVLTLNEFWNLKKLGVNEIDWLNQHFSTNIDYNKFLVRKKSEIESIHYLMMDSLFPFAKEALFRLSKIFNLIIVSRRSHPENLIEEIHWLKIDKFFFDIGVVAHGGMSKSQYIKNNYFVSSHDIIIGDTEDDIQSGINLGINTFFVLSGIRDRWIIQTFQDHHSLHIVKNLKNVIDYLTK